MLKKIAASAVALAAAATPALADDGWHGSLSFGPEVERWSCESGCATGEAGGKTKATLLNLSVRPAGVDGLSFGIYHGREFPHDGGKDNIISEVWANKNVTDRFWVGGVIASESGDNRLDVGVKAGGSVDLGNDMDLHGYAFAKHRFARMPGGVEGDYVEIEPGIGFKLTDNTGGWLNFRYQGWNWDAGVDEREWIVKPGIWHNPGGNVDYSIWAEIGEFEKEAIQYSEEYVKLGVSGSYKLSDEIKLSGTVSYKWRTDKDGLALTKKEREYPCIGLNYIIEF